MTPPKELFSKIGVRLRSSKSTFQVVDTHEAQHGNLIEDDDFDTGKVILKFVVEVARELGVVIRALACISDELPCVAPCDVRR